MAFRRMGSLAAGLAAAVMFVLPANAADFVGASGQGCACQRPIRHAARPRLAPPAAYRVVPQPYLIVDQSPSDEPPIGALLIGSGHGGSLRARVEGGYGWLPDRDYGLDAAHRVHRFGAW